MINNLFSQSLLNRNYECKVGSVFTTLAVSLERYFAVCKPLWIRIRRTPPLLYIVIVTLFAFGFNIPKFMEFEVGSSKAGTNHSSGVVLLLQGSAKERSLGCVKRAPAARGGKEAGITQPAHTNHSFSVRLIFSNPLKKGPV